MGDHTHAQGGLMTAYRYMRMDMDGMQNGTNSASTQDIFDANYAVAHESMLMEMHMFGIMYAPTPKLTLAAMTNYTETEMVHAVAPAVAMIINNGQSHFTTHTKGISDTKISALYNLLQNSERSVHISLGLSLPTGAIDQTDSTPAMGGRVTQQLPAPMQLGSGTFDFMPAFTYRRQYNSWSYGLQANGTIRLENQNDQDYRLGNQYELVSWTGYNLADWISLNTGISFKYTGKMKGTQADLNQMAPGMRQSVTTAFSENYGGQELTLILGTNLINPSGPLAGHRLALDLRLPLWQDLNGYQLSTDSILTIGWQKSW